VLAQLSKPVLARVQQQDVADALRRDGFCVVREVASEAYLALAASLGDIVAIEAIELRPEVGSYACSSEPVPFHTDHPAVAIVAWHCVRQDPADGASLLVDARGLVGGLSAAEVALLEGLQLAHPPLAEGHAAGFAAALKSGPEGHDVYFPPVMRYRAPETASIAAFGAFSERVREANMAAPIRFRLAPNDALFVDNRRVLHGRATLRPDSPRLLHRAWVHQQRRALTFA
jgi:Taurine catabolism dioxygenase TauD, TfdA family